jgi:hypothetical protein
MTPLQSLIGGPASKRRAEVIVHDPAGSGPKNLDNPFHDAKAQQRVGELISRAASTRSPNH